MRFTLLLAGAAAVIGLSSAEARDGCGRGWFHNGVSCVQEDDEPQYRRRYDDSRYYDDPRGYGREPPCEPGKHRVIVNGNSQCRYPGEARGGGDYRGYRGEPPCEAGKRRVMIQGNSQCR